MSFACVYKKADLRPPDVGPFVDGVPVSAERDARVREAAETKDKARCESACARFVEDAKTAGVASSSAEILSCGANGGGGSVADVLEQYARSTRADVLVVGSRGAGATPRGSLLGLIGLGSVSEHLVRHAEAPVLVVKRGGTNASRATGETRQTRESGGATARRRVSPKPEDDDFLGPPEQGFAKGAR